MGSTQSPQHLFSHGQVHASPLSPSCERTESRHRLSSKLNSDNFFYFHCPRCFNQLHNCLLATRGGLLCGRCHLPARQWELQRLQGRKALQWRLLLPFCTLMARAYTQICLLSWFQWGGRGLPTYRRGLQISHTSSVDPCLQVTVSQNVLGL